jgi:hypothetical protein
MRLNWAFFALAVVALVAYSLNRGERRIANHPRPNGTSPVLDAYIRQTVPLRGVHEPPKQPGWFGRTDARK